MALLSCEDCGAEVSSRAGSCPKCGAPIMNAADVQNAGATLTTTQLTTKRFKLHILISAVLFWGGMLLMYFGATSEEPPEWMVGLPAIIFIGLVYYIVVKVRIWWHHG